MSSYFISCFTGYTCVHLIHPGVYLLLAGCGRVQLMAVRDSLDEGEARDVTETSDAAFLPICPPWSAAVTDRALPAL